MIHDVLTASYWILIVQLLVTIEVGSILGTIWFFSWLRGPAPPRPFVPPEDAYEFDEQPH